MMESEDGKGNRTGASVAGPLFTHKTSSRGSPARSPATTPGGGVSALMLGLTLSAQRLYLIQSFLHVYHCAFSVFPHFATVFIAPLKPPVKESSFASAQDPMLCTKKSLDKKGLKEDRSGVPQSTTRGGTQDGQKSKRSLVRC